VELDNPSGFPGRSQQYVRVSWTTLERFYANRGVILGNWKEGA
jgi:hypothetical protein